MITDDSVTTRFFTKIIKTPSGCWEWTAATDRDGYGVFTSYKGKHWRANRASYDIFYGEVPEGLHVRHPCDIPACVNPTHLYAGLAQDNADDRDGRGRNYNANKTHCPRGHEYDKIEKIKRGRGSARRCITCDRVAYKKTDDKRRVQKRLDDNARYAAKKRQRELGEK